jgi:exosortase D (VPLPA-CTERM-specific)
MMFKKESIQIIKDIQPADWMKITFYGTLVIVVYYSTLISLITRDWNREDYNYGYLIPLIVLYLLWEKRRVLLSYPSVHSWKGMIPLGFGIALFWLGELAGEFFTLYFSFWLILVSLCWLHLGWKKIKAISFCLIFILTMFPLPNFIYTKVSLNLKLISSKLGVSLLHVYGMSAHREGNIIDLGFTQLQVVEACSGLRYLISLIILSILLAYFFKGFLWEKAIIVISSVPLSIITNSLRIALTGILYEVWGASVAEGFFHGFSGWFIFIFSLGILLIEMWVLRKIAPNIDGGLKKEDGKQKPEFQNSKLNIQNSELKTSNLKPQTIKSFFSPPQFIVAILLLGITLAFSHGIEFREKIPIKKSFNQFPLQLDEWTGIRQTMERRFIEALDFSDYIIVDYKNRQGGEINFYVAYYESQRKGESIHSPETCLPGSGWEFRETGTAIIPLMKGDSAYIKVNRAFMVKTGMKELAYFWFPQRGRILTNAYQLKMYTFWDALTRHRTDGALVRVITPVYPDEQMEDAELRLKSFTREIVPILGQFIPN